MQIEDVAKKIGLASKVIKYGNNMAKIDLEKNGAGKNKNSKKRGKLVLIAAMTSNASGIGKTTLSIGLADALNQLGKKCTLALREPSLGPVFGIKGGACGGGKSEILPSDEINLHFTGDFHAVESANNLLCAIVDNHIFQGNALNIDPKKILVKRCLDVNDRSLRDIRYSIRWEEINTGFNITASSEIMAILSLSESIDDLKRNLRNIMVAVSRNGNPIFARDLQAEDSLTVLLKDAIKPNLVQTKQGNPALVHLGPFANIAHGCNSIIATKLALEHSQFCVTEAGFGSDLGAEKFLDIVCRLLGFPPDVCVLTVTLSVVKEHGNGDLVKGFENVKRHIFNLTKEFGLNTMVAINFHAKDKQNEIETLKNLCEDCGVKAVIAKPFTLGAKGCLNLAKEVEKLSKIGNQNFSFCYNLEDNIKTKIEKIATKVYGASKVEYSPLAEEKLAFAEKHNFNNFFVNIAKTQFSFSDDKNLVGAPQNFTLHITDVEIRTGAKMIVPIAGNMLLMPGLGKVSNYQKIKIENGKVKNLF